MTKENEVDRIFRVLLREIETNIVCRNNIEKMNNLPGEVKERELYGFFCQLSALYLFAEHAFGYQREALQKYIDNKNQSEKY